MEFGSLNLVLKSLCLRSLAGAPEVPKRSKVVDTVVVGHFDLFEECFELVPSIID